MFCVILEFSADTSRVRFLFFWDNNWYMLLQDKRLTEVVQRFNAKNWKKICAYAMLCFQASYVAITFLNIFGPSLMLLYFSFSIIWIILLSGKLVSCEYIFALWTVNVFCFFSLLRRKDQFGLWKLLYINLSYWFKFKIWKPTKDGFESGACYAAIFELEHHLVIIK